MEPLLKPAVTARATEKSVQELLNEFLKRRFTGTPHDSPLGAVTFPLCDLFFNQTQLPDPADKPQIHLVFTDLRPMTCASAEDLNHVATDSTFTVFIRVANQGADANESDFLCRSVADNLKELFESQERYALAQKGIKRPRVPRGPVALQSSGFQARMLILEANVYYDVPRPDRAPAAP